MSAPNGQRANLLSCPRFAALLCAVRCGERPNSWVVGLASGLQRHQNQHQKLEHHGQSSQFDRADLVLGLESWAAGAGSQGDGDAGALEDLAYVPSKYFCRGILLCLWSPVSHWKTPTGMCLEQNAMD